MIAVLVPAIPATALTAGSADASQSPAGTAVATSASSPAVDTSSMHDITRDAASDWTNDAWKTDASVTTHDGADRKPLAYNVAAHNTRITVSSADEIRMDFTLRVAHGEVNPKTGAGLRLLFDYTPSSSSYSMKQLNIKSTYDDAVDAANGSADAKYWAQNVDEFYTIHQVLTSGAYDYLTISIEGDLSYPGQLDAWWNNPSGDRNINPDGRDTDPYVFATVGPWSTDGAHAAGSWSLDQLNDMDAGPFGSDTTKDYPVKALPPACVSGYVHNGCDVPRTLVGWDGGSPALWSGGQANWGLVTDYGLNGLKPGVAPANSFFVQWFDVANSFDSSNPCYQVTGFKYQWVALQNNNWVPVDDLTPSPIEVKQPVLNNFSGSSNVVAFNSTINSGNGSIGDLIARDSSGNLMPAQNADGSIDFAKAQRDQKNPQTSGTPGDEDYRGLDGYFKLVTWPVINSACTTAPSKDDPRNPLNPGISDKMTPAEAEDEVNTGEAVDTVYYKYDVPRPQVPTIGQVLDTTSGTNAGFTGIADEDEKFALGDKKAHLQSAQGDSVEIHGQGTPGDIVSLYSDDPSEDDGVVIDKANPDDMGTKGTLVGTATVGSDGKWIIKDSNPVGTVPSTRRYHAYQEQASGMQLTSNFSTINLVDFHTTGNPNITTVRHSAVVDNTINDSTSVEVLGTAKGGSDSSKLSVDVTPNDLKGAPTHTMTQCVVGTLDEDTDTFTPDSPASDIVPANSSKGFSCKDTGSDPNTGAQWYRTNYKGGKNGERFDFTARMTDNEGGESHSSDTNDLVNLYSPTPGGSGKADKNGKISGAMQSTIPSFTKTNAAGQSVKSGHGVVDVIGGDVQVKWTPNGSKKSTIVTLPDFTASTGKWSSTIPAAIKYTSGTVQTISTDAGGNVRNSNPTTYSMVVPVSALPFTGGRDFSLLAWFGLAALVALLVVIALAAVRAHSRAHPAGRHAGRR